jgi:hypothetical protein
MSKKAAEVVETPIVTFQVDRHTYQIDAGRRKVYRRFVEIETSRAAEILTRWRAECPAV